MIMLQLCRRYAWSILAALMSYGFVVFNLIFREKMSYQSPLFWVTDDHHSYIRMAISTLGDFHLAPFCWRIAVPFLAGHLGPVLPTAFLAITAVSLVLAGFLVYPILRSFGLSPIASVLGVALFHLTPMATPWLIFDFWSPDAAAFVFIFAAILAIQKHADWLFVLLLALGVTVKESVLFTVPLYYSLRAQRPIDGRQGLSTLLLATPAILILIAIRLFIPAWNSPAYAMAVLGQWGNHWVLMTPYNYLNEFVGTMRERLHSGIPLPVLIYQVSFGTFGAALLFAFLAVKSKILALRLSPLIFLAYAELLVATTTERLIVIALPALLILEAKGIETLARAIAQQISHEGAHKSE